MKRAVMTGGRKWPFHHRPEMRASLLLFRRAGVERLGQGETRGGELAAKRLPRQDRRAPPQLVGVAEYHVGLLGLDHLVRHHLAAKLRPQLGRKPVGMPWADGRHAAIVAALRGISHYAPDFIERVTYLIHGSDPHLYLGSPGKVQETWSKVQAAERA